MKVKRLLVRALVGLAAAAALSTAVIGVAHTPWGRPLLKLPLLSAMVGKAGCPVAIIEPAAFEKVRTTKLKGELGAQRPGSHSALGFVLGRTRRPDVERWVTAVDASCKAGFVKSVLECENVAAGNGAPTITRARLQFDAQERLVSVDLFRAGAEAAALFAHFQELGKHLDDAVGPATATVGTPTLQYLAGKPLRTLSRTYSYTDYVATATLLNFGKRGLKLREQYQWLAPASDPA